MIGSHLDRRQILAGVAAAGVAANLPLRRAEAAASRLGPALGPAEPFSFDALKQRAAALAKTAWVDEDPIAKEIVQQIDYDAYQKIRFRPDMSIMLDADKQLPIQLFHLGQFTSRPVRIHLVRNGQAQEIVYSANLFETPVGHPARDLPDNIGFAGFRVMAPDLKTDWIAFLGASYFRSSGPFNQYGLSARGLAIDTGLSTPEEFPRFIEFWLDEVPVHGDTMVVYALLDSPSVTGAYRITARRETDGRGVARVDQEIECELYARADITRLGIAPFSSMYWYGEADRPQAVDWRPEIHDSDGLAIWTGSGERIWRPLNNPPRVMTNTFIDKDVRGFGLLQRDRNLVHYLDDSVFYERRASSWIEPIEPFGEGEVHLLEIPTDDEIHDNIAAYWWPREPLKAGTSRRFHYWLRWLDDIPFPTSLARATATWTGIGGRPGQARPKGVRKFVVDFKGPVLKDIGRDDGVEIIVTASRGEITNAYTHPVVDQREHWRAFFDIDVSGGEDPVDMRLYLRRGEDALTETWVYQYFPEQA